MAIHLSGPPGDCPSCEGRTGRPCPTLGLAPGGVYRADPVARVAGALLPHRFTLACAGRSPPSAVCSLWHCPAGRPDWPLASTLPCGAPTFLDPVPAARRPTRAAATRPAHRRLQCGRSRLRGEQPGQGRLDSCRAPSGLPVSATVSAPRPSLLPLIPAGMVPNLNAAKRWRAGPSRRDPWLSCAPWPPVSTTSWRRARPPQRASSPSPTSTTRSKVRWRGSSRESGSSGSAARCRASRTSTGAPVTAISISSTPRRHANGRLRCCGSSAGVRPGDRSRTVLGREGIDLQPGMVVVLRGTLDFYRARGRDRLHPGRARRHRAARSVGCKAGGSPACLGRRGFARAQPVALGAGGPPACRASWPARAPRATATSWASLIASGYAFRVTVVPAPVQGPEAPAAVASAVSVLAAAGRQQFDVWWWYAAVGRRPIWPPSTPSRWPGRSPSPRCRCGRASATPGTSRWPTSSPTGRYITPTDCGRELASRVGHWWEEQVATPAGFMARASAEAVSGAERRGLDTRARVAATARHLVRRQSELLGARAGIAARCAPRLAEEARTSLDRRSARSGPLACPPCRSGVGPCHLVAPFARCLRRRAPARAGLHPHHRTGRVVWSAASPDWRRAPSSRRGSPTGRHGLGSKWPSPGRRQGRCRDRVDPRGRWPRRGGALMAAGRSTATSPRANGSTRAAAPTWPG